MLGNRHGDAGNIDLLEGVLANQAGADVAGDGNHGDRVHIRGGDAGDQIGRARAARGQTDAGFAGCAGISVRRVRRALLVCGQHMPDAVAVEIQRIVNIKNRAARISENGVNALLYQDFTQNL